MTVNVSGRQLARPEFLDEVEAALGRCGLPPGSLGLEITESVLMNDVSSPRSTLEALRALGVRVLLDDFGTGYSSLSRLKGVPVDAIKVDRSFVDGLAAEDEDTAIVSAIVDIASSLGLSAIAEGVETRAQLDALRQLGCDGAQGYLFAAPMSADEFEGLLAAGAVRCSSTRPPTGVCEHRRRAGAAPPTTLLRIRLTPRAARERIAPGPDGGYLAHVTAPPVDGAANDALRRLVARAAGVAPSRVSVVRGQRGRAEGRAGRGGRRGRRARGDRRKFPAARPLVALIPRGSSRRGHRSLRRSFVVGRVLVVAAVLAAIAVVGTVLLNPGGPDYIVRARFANAAQLVKGNLVQVAGVRVGSISRISLTEDGQAEVAMKIDDDAYRPLRRGTRAIIRQASLSGVANRYVDLQLPPGDRTATIPDRGVIGQGETTTAVDLDQLFNTFDPKTRSALSGLIRGENEIYAGRGKQAGAGWAYLNPALAASDRLFQEVNVDTPLLQRFVGASARLVDNVAQRRTQLAGLVDHLSTTTGALGRQSDALGRGIGSCPTSCAGRTRRSSTSARRSTTPRRWSRSPSRSRRSCARSSPSCARSCATRGRRCATCRRRSTRPARTTTSSS